VLDEMCKHVEITIPKTKEVQKQLSTEKCVKPKLEKVVMR